MLLPVLCPLYKPRNLLFRVIFAIFTSNFSKTFRLSRVYFVIILATILENEAPYLIFLESEFPSPLLSPSQSLSLP